jgi:hypothetical protein
MSLLLVVQVVPVESPVLRAGLMVEPVVPGLLVKAVLPPSLRSEASMSSHLHINCTHCPEPNAIMTFSRAEGQTEEEFASAWKAAATTFKSISCGCGSRFRVECDGIEVNSGGFVQVTDISSPRIDSLNVVGGKRFGGEALIISGSSLDIGKLVVKFGGNPAQAVTNVTPSHARVVTPTGQYTLNVQEVISKYTFTSTSGIFNVNDVITTAQGSIGTLRLINGNDYWIGWSVLNETVASMIGMLLTSSSKSARVVASSATPAHLVGESVHGLTSKARGAVKSTAPFVVNKPTAAFVAGELVRGDASGAYVLLANQPYSGTVDVSVENEHGQRVVGGVVKNGFTYL